MAPAVGEAPVPRTDLLIVTVGNERLALRTEAVAEVIRPKPLSRVPLAPAAVLGVLNLRGAVLPVLSLARLRDGEMREIGPSARIVVLDLTPPVGLLVDAVAVTAGQGAAVLLDPVALMGDPAIPRRAESRQVVQSTARPPNALTRQNETLSVLCFTVSDQWFGLPVGEVVAVTVVPPDAIAVAGLDGSIAATAARAGVIPLIAARTVLGHPAGGAGRGAVVVVRVEGEAVGLVVDRVTGVAHAPVAAIEPVPPILMRGGREAKVQSICRLDGERQLLCLLSAKSLFEGTRVRAEGANSRSEALDTKEDAPRECFLIFQLADEHYGFPLKTIVEVVRLVGDPSPIPNAPAFVRGVITLRGQVLPVIEAGARLGVKTAVGADGEARGRRVIVVDLQGTRVGFIVDAVSTIRAVRTDALLPASDIGTADPVLFDHVIPHDRDGRLILSISPQALLAQAEREVIASLGQGTTKRVPRRTPHAPA